MWSDHGISEFLPRIEVQGEGGHIVNIVNVASMTGVVSAQGRHRYCAGKYAAVALSEWLAAELAGSGICWRAWFSRALFT